MHPNIPSLRGVQVLRAPTSPPCGYYSLADQLLDSLDNDSLLLFIWALARTLQPNSTRGIVKMLGNGNRLLTVVTIVGYCAHKIVIKGLSGWYPTMLCLKKRESASHEQRNCMDLLRILRDAIASNVLEPLQCSLTPELTYIGSKAYLLFLFRQPTQSTM